MSDKTKDTLFLKSFPNIAWIFLKAFWVSPFRSNKRAGARPDKKGRIILNNCRITSGQLEKYCRVCRYTPPPNHEIPLSFFQTLFISLLGRFITSSFFSFTPFGLVQTAQSFELKRRVLVSEVLDLHCTLDKIARTPKGFESVFLLQVFSRDELVWQGESVFLSRTGKKTGRPKNKSRADKKPFPPDYQVIQLDVPPNIGRQYARVSGDYNPHHLHGSLAKLFGFKTAIAHGMWTLARSLASLDRRFGTGPGAQVRVFFKLPVFIPATLSFGYKTLEPEEKNSGQIRVVFELRDAPGEKPHLTGELFLPASRHHGP